MKSVPKSDYDDMVALAELRGRLLSEAQVRLAFADKLADAVERYERDDNCEDCEFYEPRLQSCNDLGCKQHTVMTHALRAYREGGQG